MRNEIDIFLMKIIVVMGIFAGLLLLMDCFIPEKAEVPAQKFPPVEIVQPELPLPDQLPPPVDTDAVDALAKTVYGEARGCSKTQQAAVVWCILNRADKNGTTEISSIITAPGQFYGYSALHPVLPQIRELVEDVLIRWQMEKFCVGSVGRVLPSDYLYFTGSGGINHFSKEYNSNRTWDWSLPSPYEVQTNG